MEQEWEVYPVLHLSFGSENFTQPYALDKMLESFVADAENQYGTSKALTLRQRFCKVLHAVHQATGRRAVVLIDEYDKPLLDVLDMERYVTDCEGNRIKLEDYNRDVLRGFYGVFKDADADLHFVMLTGVTKFSQVSFFSGFNQPDDISMDERYEALCGITKEELETVFAESIQELAEKYRVDCRLELKDYVYIFELKMDGSADEALQQIEDRGYAKPYVADPRHVIRIGMNFSSETRTIAQWKCEKRNA